MAHYKKILCLRCREQKEMICSDNPAKARPRHCGQCLIEMETERRTEKLDELASLTLEERVRRLEKTAYDL